MASLGYPVTIGSRSRYRAMEIRDTIVSRWPDHHLELDASDNEGAASAEVVVIATPWDGAAETALSVKEALAGKVVISMANALARVGGEFQPLVPPRGSVAASVQAAVPKSLVSAAMHHLPAKELGAIDRPIESDVLICSDHLRPPRSRAGSSAASPASGRSTPGSSRTPRRSRPSPPVLLQLNVRYKTRVAVKLTGIADEQAGPVTEVADDLPVAGA
jgi:hypothetical protein